MKRLHSTPFNWTPNPGKVFPTACSSLLALTRITLQIPIQRYSEKNGSNVRAVHEVALDGEDADALTTNEAELDGELAELSLGEKLAASTTVPHLRITSTKAENPEDNSVPSHADPVSLTRALIQALHSNNAQLLESVLRTKGDQLILNTVRKLPATFAVPLVRECVARLNRGHGAGLDGAKAARGSAVDASTGKLLIRWLRATLITHTSHLLSVSPVLMTSHSDAC